MEFGSTMNEVQERVTVAFSLDALETLQDPGHVFQETRGWVRSVGIVSDRPVHTQTGFARRHGLDYGFHSGPRDLLESLPVIRLRPEHSADRYLLIGSNLNKDDIVGVGWEYLSIGEAADATGWRLNDGSESDSTREWP